MLNKNPFKWNPDKPGSLSSIHSTISIALLINDLKSVVSARTIALALQ